MRRHCHVWWHLRMRWNEWFHVTIPIFTQAGFLHGRAIGGRCTAAVLLVMLMVTVVVPAINQTINCLSSQRSSEMRQK